MRTLGVFCGSCIGNRPEYQNAAVELGLLMARENIALVFGGGKVGMMGIIATTVLEHGGKVTGVITRDLNEMGLALSGWPGQLEMIVTETLALRKQRMFELSDGFMALAGGFGTLDEIFEAVTCTQLHVHAKPCGMLNTCGFYDNLLGQISVFFNHGFIGDNHISMLASDSSPGSLLEKMRAYRHEDGGTCIGKKGD